MSKWDVEYLKLCKKILTEGVEVENRTGINTMKISDYNFNFDLKEEFPDNSGEYENPVEPEFPPPVKE